MADTQRMASDDHLVSDSEVDEFLAAMQAAAEDPGPPMTVSEDPEDAWAIIKEARNGVHHYGGTVAWRTKDGGVASAYVGFAVLDGEIWTTTTKGRAKTFAWQRDPRASFVFASRDRKRSTTVYGRVELLGDERDVTRFAIGFSRYRSGRQEIGPAISSFDSPGRYAVRFIPERFVTRSPAFGLP